VKAPDALGDPYEDFPEDCTETLDAKTVLKIASACKEYGNKAFKGGDFNLGRDKYQKGLRYLNEDPDLDSEPPETKKEMDGLRFVLNSNSALLNIKLEAWDEAVRSADSALTVAGTKDTDRAKALYRRGFAYVRLKDDESALTDLEQAHTLVPDDKVILAELQAVKKKAAARAAKEKAAYKKFFT
jgi:peptidyl-prolyl isomerase D